MRIVPTVLGFLTLLASSCSRTTEASRVIITTNAGDIAICCNPNEEPPVKVGDFKIQIYEGQLEFLDPETIEATFTSTITRIGSTPGVKHKIRPPVSLSLDSGEPLEIGSTAIEVFVENCFFERVNVTFLAEVVGRRVDNRALTVLGISRTFAVINTCPPREPPPSPPQSIVEAILGFPVSDFEQYGQDTPTGVPVANPSPEIDPQVPAEGSTETFQVGAYVADLTQQQLDDAFLGLTPTFPIGLGSFGLTLMADSPAQMDPGPYLLTWQCVEEDIPLEIEGKQLQYGFLADRDADSQNNFRAMPPLDNDPLDDTDTWYIAQYESFGGWRLSVVDTQSGQPQLLPSGVRVIFFDQVQFFVIPVADLGMPTEILARYTTFQHEGDFGQAGLPWSADVTNPVGEPRIPITIQQGQ